MITGTLGALNAVVELGDGSPSRASFMAVQVTGTFSATLTFQGTVDGTNWVALSALPFGSLYDSTTAVTTATAAGLFRLDTAGLAGVRVKATAYTSGTATVSAVPVTG